MDILQVFQTIGICVGAVALVAIAFLLLLVVSSLEPNLNEPDEKADPLHFLRGKSREEIHQILTTPVYESRPRRKPRAKSDQPDDDKK
jgi:hypothetical protein